MCFFFFFSCYGSGLALRDPPTVCFSSGLRIQPSPVQGWPLPPNRKWLCPWAHPAIENAEWQAFAGGVGCGRNNSQTITINVILRKRYFHCAFVLSNRNVMLRLKSFYCAFPLLVFNFNKAIFLYVFLCHSTTSVSKCFCDRILSLETSIHVLHSAQDHATRFANTLMNRTSSFHMEKEQLRSIPETNAHL